MIDLISLVMLARSLRLIRPGVKALMVQFIGSEDVEREKCGRCAQPLAAAWVMRFRVVDMSHEVE